MNAVGLGYSEIDLVYTAGLIAIPDTVKVACAQIVRNAQATPALNVRSGKLDRMQLDYSPAVWWIRLSDPVGAIRGAESGLSMSQTGIQFGIFGMTLVRAAEAMLRSLWAAPRSGFCFRCLTAAGDLAANWVWRIPGSKK